MKLSANLDAKNETLGLMVLKPGETLKALSAENTLDGTVVLEKEGKGMASFELVSALTDGVEYTYRNLSQEIEKLRIRMSACESGDADVSLEDVRGELIESLITAKDGAVVLSLDDEGDLVSRRGIKLGQGVSDINSYEELETNGSAPVAVSLSVYQSKITTSGSGAEDLEIGDGSGAIIGQRKLIVLETLGDAADSVVLDDASFSQGSDTITAIELDAEGEFILAEFQGATWEVIAASSGVVTAS